MKHLSTLVETLPRHPGGVAVHMKVGPDDRETMREIAASMRRRADQREPHFSTQHIVAECFPGTTVGGADLDPHDQEAVYVHEHAFRSHRAPHRLLYKRGLSTPEQRFAIAHGIAHIQFDGPRQPWTRHDRARELRCDRFADELLCPLEFLREYVGPIPKGDRDAYLDMVDLIAAHFQVPAAVIERQIKRLRGH